ncbi:DUF3862 domain-containing protein [Thermodesulfobacteriota bacterium]
MLFRQFTKGLFILLIFISFMITGCSKVTIENYEKLKVGMSYEEVIAVIGAADECSEKMGTKSCTWGSAEKVIKVKFVADNAVYFSKKGI